MKYYLYQITNRVNGKVYVGVHKTRNVDDGYMGSGKVIKAAIEKHGAENFHKEILEIFDNAADAFEREKEIVNEEFLARDDVYNLRRGGSGGFDYINSQMTSEQRRRYGRMANTKPGTSAYVKRFETDIEFRRVRVQQLADARDKGTRFLGKSHSEESKRKIGAANKRQRGELNSQYGTIWITDGRQNKKVRGSIPDGWRRGRV